MDINGRRGRIVLVYPEPNNRVQVKKGVTSLCRPTQEQRVRKESGFNQVGLPL